MTIEVRIARPTDIPGILAIAAQVQAFHADAYPDIFRPVPAEGLPEQPFREAIAASAESVLVAMSYDELVGYARLERQTRPESAIKYARAQLYVHEIGVRADRRRVGVGTRLMAEIRAIALAEGLASIAIEAMASNISARNFYAAQGFHEQRSVLVRPASAEGESRPPVP